MSSWFLIVVGLPFLAAGVILFWCVITEIKDIIDVRKHARKRFEDADELSRQGYPSSAVELEKSLRNQIFHLRAAYWSQSKSYTREIFIQLALSAACFFVVYQDWLYLWPLIDSFLQKIS